VAAVALMIDCAVTVAVQRPAVIALGWSSE
jgi:hypothetical protein